MTFTFFCLAVLRPLWGYLCAKKKGCFSVAPRIFEIFGRPKLVPKGSKQAKTTRLSIPRGLGSLLKRPPPPCLTLFCSENPFSRVFRTFGETGSLWARHRLKILVWVSQVVWEQPWEKSLSTLIGRMLNRAGLGYVHLLSKT